MISHISLLEPVPGNKSMKAGNRLRRQLGELRAALADGWEIVQPIFARPHWSALQNDRLAFHFVLQRNRATRLVTVPESGAVLEFISARSLSIDRRMSE
jgi:hypothetical protein